MQHEWKVERPLGTGVDPETVCLNCGSVRTEENKDSECKLEEICMVQQLQEPWA